MQAQEKAPIDMQCADKFLVQAVRAPNGTTIKDLTAEMVSHLFMNFILQYKTMSSVYSMLVFSSSTRRRIRLLRSSN